MQFVNFVNSAIQFTKENIMLERIKPSDFESETQAKEFDEMSIELALNFLLSQPTENKGE